MPCAKPKPRIFLFTNHSPGQIVSRWQNIREQDILVAVDGGLQRLHELNLKPTVIIGDFDSVDASLLSNYSDTPRIEHAKEKNETDTELALLWCIKQSDVAEIIICNDLQGRFDHALGIVQNLFMLHKLIPKSGEVLFPPFVRCESETQVLFFLPPKISFNNLQGKYLSLIPYTEQVVFLSSEGLKYSLNGLVIKQYQSRGISNEFNTAEAQIIKASGEALAVITQFPE